MRGIWKSTFREIKSGFGRFMAILAIVALGVGFFAGLKVTTESMKVSVGDYLNRHAFYDFRLLSTLGFEQEDVEYLDSQGECVAEGALSYDVIYDSVDGNRAVLKIHSLTEKVNTLKLISGRMPEAANECVVDSNLFGESAIGSTIVLSKDNEEDTLDSFAHHEYTIVGTVYSPLYIQFERGNTSIGSGRISGFAYVPAEAFDVDYFTEIYVRFTAENVAKMPLHSEEYKAFIDEKEVVWEALAKEAGERRYQSIMDEANGELADARAEFEEKKAEGEAELADAKETLEDAKRQLADGEKALADAKIELADAEETLAEKEAELEDGKKTLAEKEAEFADGEKELADGIVEWNDNNWQVQHGKEQIELGDIELREQRDELAKQKDMLEMMAGLGMIPAPQYEAYMAQIAAGEQQIAMYQQELDDNWDKLIEAEEELAKAWAEIEDAKLELEDGRIAIADAKKELADGEQAIADAKEELADAKVTLAEKEAELIDAQKELSDGEKEYQDALVEFDEKIAEAEEELAEAEEEINDIEEAEVFVLGRDTNVGYVCFESDSEIVAGVANIFPVFFFMVAALVCVTTMNRMVEEQRTQIGVLKALGYSDFAVMLKYLVYSGTAALIGCVGGFALGTWAFPEIIWYVYGIMYQADSLIYVFNWKLALISLVVSMLCSIGTTWLSCRNELRQVPAALMRPKAPKAGKRIFLEYIPFVWKRLSFLQKVSMRNIFRYKKRLFMMVLGISGCTSMLVAAFGLKDSISGIATKQFGTIQTFDMSVSFMEPVEETDLAGIEGLRVAGIEDYTTILEKSMDLVTEDGVKGLYVVVGDRTRMKDFQHLQEPGGDVIPYPENGTAVISHKIADEYNVAVGDVVTLRDEDMKSLEVEISGIYENYMYNYVHMSQETWEHSFGEQACGKTVYVNMKDGTDAYALAAELMQLDGVSNVTINADMMERINSMLSSLNLIVIVVVICAAGLAFIVLYNLTNINITERIREIATVKVLGFYKKETAVYVFRENLMLTVMGIVVGLFLGKALHAVIMSMIKVDMVAFEIVVKPLSYVYSVVLTYVFAWVVNKAMGGKLDRVSMTESLKSVD